jgi:hypothetical protein
VRWERRAIQAAGKKCFLKHYDERGCAPAHDDQVIDARRSVALGRRLHLLRDFSIAKQSKAWLDKQRQLARRQR